ncbi:DNA-binding transcriptional regulator, AcrR family [Actinokineospora alba]|uniref:DNA-binding transcriptional regulator, AcrR family n=1 Tax=Actinokineospora alba TaxID=504798 RepID=A0A1H0G8W8_9PSEU|nr:TetR/AcrR family transcriptional regulator [Actinokineospora alba]TDP69808.1 TetR family transcriptional regulator [Actinokineospora alba]SDI08197.1 DNA-binding transcriptional regulator, AcrR family [Actinokineospora alba]SDO03306.1 DNA-binding transcriptional regulator, AcrR family [Actinokineospora alba]
MTATKEATGKRPYAPRMPAAERREQLLDAALEIINTRGLAAVSIDAVAKACDVTRPVVYGQFTDAHHLLKDLLDREARHALGQLAAAAALPVDVADPAKWFADVCRALVGAVLERPATWRAILLPVGAVPAPVREYRRQGEQAVMTQFAGVARRFLRGRGNAADVDVVLLARSLVRVAEEMGRLLLEAPEEYPPERVLKFAAMAADAFLTRYPALQPLVEA